VSLQLSGGEIASVAPGGLGEALELRRGDRLLAINNHVLRDVIDCRFYGAEEHLQLRLRRGETEIIVEAQREYGQELGLDFVQPTFDTTRLCTNACEFCFISQLPEGLRPALYIRDDDYRLSFLSGTFVTLTNLAESDWERLARQRLSPLYVSVHATGPVLRRRMLGREVPDILRQLQRLGRLGIHVHAQVVLVPGLNDGQHLERTVFDLAELYPTVESVALVPVGLTRYHRGGCRPYTPVEARKLLVEAESWRQDYRHRWGVGFLYPADEWYLLAGEPVPSARDYDGFPQLENGIGLVRGLVDDWRAVRGSLASSRPVAPGEYSLTLVCGTLIAPILMGIADELSSLTGLGIEVIPVVNRFLGRTVTVSGLLTGQDIVCALRGQDLGDVVILPRAMFDALGDRTLDEWTPDRVGEQLGVQIWVAGDMTEVVGRVCRQ
jgi:putative radical SAM enzyme (TIGR03279 family)